MTDYKDFYDLDEDINSAQLVREAYYITNGYYGSYEELKNWYLSFKK